MKRMTQHEQESQAKQLAGLVRGKLHGLATMLRNGAPPDDVAADLEAVARDMRRELASLVGTTKEKLWPPNGSADGG